MTPRVARSTFLVGALVVALVVAFFLSSAASSQPDGLERAAIDAGFAGAAEDEALVESPTADYRVDGVDDERLSTGLAGVIGVGVTFGAAYGLLALVRHRRRHPARATASPSERAG